MKLKISELEEQVNKYLQAIGMNAQDAGTLTALVVEQELVGNAFSAVGELDGKHKRLLAGSDNTHEEVVMDKPAAMLFKGNGRMAPLITADHLDEAIIKAKNQGIYAFGVYDSTYNEFFDIFCRRIAAQDCIGIIVENGGPQGVVPYGGKTDVTGTNPLAYGIPTNTYPIIFDAATAVHAYGLIRKAREGGQALPDNAYVDSDGNVTTNPQAAVAVMPFGGFKGYAINLLIDVLSGSLVRGKSGLDQPLDSQRYIGTFIIVIDPASFGELEDFKASTTKLANDLLTVEPINPSEPVHVPGFRGAKRWEQFEAAGIIEINDEDWQKFEKAYKDAVGTTRV